MTTPNTWIPVRHDHTGLVEAQGHATDRVAAEMTAAVYGSDAMAFVDAEDIDAGQAFPRSRVLAESGARALAARLTLPAIRRAAEMAVGL